MQRLSSLEVKLYCHDPVGITEFIFCGEADVLRLSFGVSIL